MIKPDSTDRKSETGPDQIAPAPILWYRLLFTAAVLLSVGGFFYGACHVPSSDGGRGGALADVLAFFLLFVRSDFPLDSYRARKHVIPDLHRQMVAIMARLRDSELAPVDEQEEEQNRTLEGILAMIQAIGQDQRHQNFYIAWASVVGTLSWGFGDIVATHLKVLLNW